MCLSVTVTTDNHSHYYAGYAADSPAAGRLFVHTNNLTALCSCTSCNLNTLLNSFQLEIKVKKNCLVPLLHSLILKRIQNNINKVVFPECSRIMTNLHVEVWRFKIPVCCLYSTKKDIVFLPSLMTII